MKKRIEWIDRLKAIGFYFVILGHSAIGKTLKSWVYSFHMPLFLMVSGFNFNIEKLYNTSVKDYVIKLTKRMLIPYFWLQMISLSILYFKSVFITHKDIPVIGMIKGAFVGNSIILDSSSNPMYFILLLFVAELILFFIIKLVKGRQLPLTLAVVILLPVSLLTKDTALPWHINVVPIAMFYIITGYYLKKLYEYLKSDNKKIHPALYYLSVVLLFGIGFALWIYNGRFSLHGNTYGKTFFLAFPCSVCTSVAITMLTIKLPKTGILEFIGKNTFFYLAMHKPLMIVLDALFRTVKTNPVYIAVSTVFIFFVLAPIVMLCNKYMPVLCGLQTGTNAPGQRAAQLICTAFSLSGAYIFAAGTLIDTINMNKTVLVIAFIFGFLIICGVGFLFVNRFMPFIYGIDKNNILKKTVSYDSIEKN